MRFLVSVASKHGATAEIGASLAEELARNGRVGAVEVVDPAEVSSVAGYDAIVLGGAIYADRLLPAIVDLTDRCEGELRAVPVFLFASGPMGAVTDPPQLPEQIGAIAQRIGARSVRLFGGRVDTGRLGSVERTVMHMIGSKDGDWRDMTDVRRWAAQVVDLAADPGTALAG